ncbi:MAG: NUDIX hydrolase [Lachnospira sp.]|uniref:Mutator mutT protein n=1 Tax=Lachnospira pectinoschiza TaxID=28052 RepID=A0A1G9WVW6_9FIRM|nr:MULTISPECIES: NUDIX hydrolase [Lachnospira]MCR5516757.1 NUDIX hydrolase [Lachnospira sp.]SDM88590.1 mutator mutT protein [Lachnospira pectinoschiza]
MREETVTVKIDHPLGSTDEDNPSIVYPINCGYVERDCEIGQNGEFSRQEAYVLGVDVPLDEFTGVLTAVARRKDDANSVWLVVPENIHYTRQQLEEMIYFSEQYYDGFVEVIDDEIWDGYDCDEHRLGLDVKRSQAKSLPEGVYHVVVMVYTITKDEGKILVTQRSRNKTYPLKWEVTGGSILKGETARQGAARELLEETGIKVAPEDLIPLYEFSDARKHVIYHSYINLIESETKIKLQLGETMDYKFIPYEEFIEMVESERFVPSEQKRYGRFKELINEKVHEYI